MRKPPIRLAFGSLFWRAFLVLAVILEFALWHKHRAFLMGRNPGFRVAAMIYLSPKMIFRSFLIAAIFTVLVDLYVRLLMRPLIARRYSPRAVVGDFAMPVEFQLAWNEAISAEIPARMLTDRRLQPGKLARSDRRIWFMPHAWDEEFWTLPIDDLVELRTVPPPSRFGSLVVGIPDRLVFEAGDGAETMIVVADPESVLSWFPDHTIRDEVPYEPSPLQLL